MPLQLILLSSVSLILAFLSGCTTLSEREQVEKRIGEITTRHAENFPSHYKLALIGDGYRGHDKLFGVKLHYAASQPKSLDEIRRILVLLVESYLRDFNRDESIKGELRAPPFTHENLYIIIAFRDQNGEPIYMTESSEPISYVMMMPEKVFYKSEGRGLGERKTIFEETYEEALHKVKALEGEEQSGSEGFHD